MTDNCAFCAIATGEQWAERVFEDDWTIAFSPLNPAVAGHVLVIPRQHFVDIWDLDPQVAHRLSDSVLHIADAMRRGLRPDGLNVINSTGRAASQSIFHVHVHLVPRWVDDAFGDIWPRSPQHDRERLSQAVELVRSALRVH